jgi:G3E family GTPase
MVDKIPVTVLTGFLGSGKTTLLNRILTENHGQRIAVIENEFGEIGVDQDLVINADEEVFEMNNGCICCTVRGDLIRILGNLIKRRDKFDRVVLETTGLANPGPVAQTFFVDDEVREHFALDGIVTLVDARHLPLHLDNSDEAREQVAFADVIVVNKVDLVPEAELQALEHRLRSMNAMAKLQRAHMASVPMSQVIGIGGFDLARALEYKPTFLKPEYPFEWGGVYDIATVAKLRLSPGPDPSMKLCILPVDNKALPALAEQAMRSLSGDAASAKSGELLVAEKTVYELLLDGDAVFDVRVAKPGHYALFTQHLPSEFDMQVEGALLIDSQEFAAEHSHDDAVSSVSLVVNEPLQSAKFKDWLDDLLREFGNDIFRLKGFLNFSGVPNRIVIQGVHMLVDTQVLDEWGDKPRNTLLVLIGRKLDGDGLLNGLRRCIA